ncbi:putative ankyrin repeat protein [Erysiphe neolycopersici]|uniref:Putative ankyrin repeat protein n=1 Tax=Erysiphe neolycopersici TaxID=212602 RepID=A0A420HQX0_9PEZI|nr:putative ankyrin repeat protein [Erysiphe neolycopersici]
MAMRNPGETTFSANSPPIFLELKMSEQLDMDPDFEFFDSTALDSANSPSQFVDDIGPDATSQFLSNLLSPKNQNHYERSRTMENNCQSGLPTSQIESPTGSYQDSSSESSDYPRKSSSASLTSGLTPGDIMMGDDTELMGGWKNLLGSEDNIKLQGTTDGCINPSAVNTSFLSNESSFDQDLSFGSSASSPSFKTGVIGMESPEISNIKARTPTKQTVLLNNFKSEKTTSQPVIMPPAKRNVATGSREVSPLSAMISNHDSPPTFFPSPSPGTTSLCNKDYVNYGMFTNSSTIPKWPMNLEIFQNPGFQTAQKNQHINPIMANSRPSMNFLSQSKLTIHPTPLKSRVETQIPIKMTLFPLPPGVTKLHLPTHTISKPKLLSKPTPERSPDTLELHTSLVCTSAMLNPELKKRAFERAAASSSHAPISPKEEPEEFCSDEDDENKPINGGEVKICGGCIIRERKRAARKKAKKVEEEESWQRYETQRVIVFNTHEVKDWQVPSQYLPSELIGDHPEPYVPEGAMQVDAPMRIACYCRHQNEKAGFQVIFTIKDHQDKLVAQAITSSIMITDDHKTSTVTSANTQVSNTNNFIAGSCHFSEASYDGGNSLLGNSNLYRTSYSSSDLHSMQQQRSISNEMSATSSMGNSPRLSHSISASATPHISRQTSPSSYQGSLSKKRKSSGTNKFPSSLAMTRLESGENNLINPTTSAIPSPFTPNFPSFSGASDQQFNLTNSIQSVSPGFNGPPTPNSIGQIYSQVNKSKSMENLAIQPMYNNAPSSGIISRTSSPIEARLESYQRQQAQLAQAVSNGFYGIPMSLNVHRPPIIHKMIPSEGPKAGGIEVTCLGIGFVQGLEVMFGDIKATTTTFWGETSLVCLLPPSSYPGNYPVTFKHQHQQQQMQSYPIPVPKQQTYFKYVDDDELQILRTALSVLGHKMSGKMEDVRDLARRIVGESIPNWGTSSIMNSDSSQINGGTGFNNASVDLDLETTLLKVLELIDLDDSPQTPRFKIRGACRQTMHDSACSLRYNRLVL